VHVANCAEHALCSFANDEKINVMAARIGLEKTDGFLLFVEEKWGLDYF
jgi:hypothetical protein